MSFLFQTDRLRCRRGSAADVEPVHAIHSDPAAMRWIGDGQPITREACEKWFDVTETNYETRGYGMFALEEKNYRPRHRMLRTRSSAWSAGGRDQVRLSPASLGKGVAGEVVPPLLRYACKELGLNRVVATVDLGNLVSQKVLARAGAKFVQRRLESDGGATLVFEWLAPNAARPLAR